MTTTLMSALMRPGKGVKCIFLIVCLLETMGWLSVEQPLPTKKHDGGFLMSAALDHDVAAVPEQNMTAVVVVVVSKDDAVVSAPAAVVATDRGVSPKKKKKKTTRPIFRKEVVVKQRAAKPSSSKMLAFFSNSSCQAPPTKEINPAAEWLHQMIVNIGVMKGGTKAIHTFLEEHPKFVSRCSKDKATKELHFFNRRNVTNLVTNGSILNQPLLQAAYAQRIQAQCPVAVQELAKDATKLYLDDTPPYIQSSDTIPQLLNCVVPHAKLMAILRNPTDRAFSHYNFYKKTKNKCGGRSFEEWVDINIKELSEAGMFLFNTTMIDDPYEELLAWQRYQQELQRKNQGMCTTFLTRGLYAVQLLHFQTALQAAGRNVDRSMLVLESDWLKRSDKRQATYNTMLKFLGLEPHVLKKRKAETVHATAYKEAMDDATRAKLDAFFRPYNQRLYKMLKWDPVWG